MIKSKRKIVKKGNDNSCKIDDDQGEEKCILQASKNLMECKGKLQSEQIRATVRLKQGK